MPRASHKETVVLSLGPLPPNPSFPLTMANGSARPFATEDNNLDEGAKLTLINTFDALMQALLSRKDDGGRLIATPFVELSQVYADPIRNGRVPKSMWFDKILRNIKEGMYTTKQAFATDVGLVFRNAIVVYGEESSIGRDVGDLKQYIKQLAPELWFGYDEIGKPSAAEGCRRALFIAIGYPGKDGQKFELHSHKHLESLQNLIKSYGYFENIDVLADDGIHTMPTRNNILAAMENLVKDAKPGDRFFLYYCGHGAQIDNKDGTEKDFKDELILPVDCRENTERDLYDVERYPNHILDDTLHEILVKNLPIGCRLQALFDCCNSGTMMDLVYCRGYPRCPRYTPGPLCEEPSSGDADVQEKQLEENAKQVSTDNAAKRSGSGGPLNLPHTRSGARRRKGTYRFKGETDDPKDDAPPLKADVVSWGSCMDGQRAWQHPQTGGVMTQAFIGILENEMRPTYEELLRNLRERMSSIYQQLGKGDGETIKQEPQVGFNNPPDMKERFSL
ncbi:caspase domain-containing protein [Gautieria morchelliformis]|nr:caspase domain-containing protein [Gautieria morchelliformis]